MRYAVYILEKIRKQVIVAATSVEDAKINGLAIAKDIESNEDAFLTTEVSAYRIGDDNYPVTTIKEGGYKVVFSRGQGDCTRIASI